MKIIQNWSPQQTFKILPDSAPKLMVVGKSVVDGAEEDEASEELSFVDSSMKIKSMFLN